MPNPRLLRLPNGLALDVHRRGDPAGLPVVLLPGITDSWRSFERVLLHLPNHLRLLAVSPRGHGDSAKPDAGYAIADFADDLAGLLDVCGIDGAVVVGHSLGSSVALRFAAAAPERVRGLVLVGAFAAPATNPALTGFVADVVARLDDPIDALVARAFQEGTLARPVPEEFLDLVVAESRKVPARVWRAAFAGLLADDSAHDLARVRAPALLVRGERDPLVPRADAEELLARLPDARLVTYRRAGHAPHWEMPERFAFELLRFTTRCAPARVTVP